MAVSAREDEAHLQRPDVAQPESKPVPGQAMSRSTAHPSETPVPGEGQASPQLTLRAVLTGAVVGALLSVSNVYMVLKTGLSFGVAITSCVLSFALWKMIRMASGDRHRGLSILESNCMQSTASATGYSTGNMMAVTFAALMMLDPQHRQQPWWVIAAFTFTTASLGVFMAIPLKRLFIDEARLPFPSGTAAAVTLTSLYSDTAEAAHRSIALACSLASGVLFGILNTAEDQFVALGRFFTWMRLHLFSIQIPSRLPSAGFGQLDGKALSGFFFEPSLALAGAGMLVGLRLGLSMLASSMVLYLVVAPELRAWDLSHASAGGYLPSLPLSGGGKIINPLRWAVWGGASILVVSSLVALALEWKMVVRATRALRFTGGRRPGRTAPDRRPDVSSEVPRTWVLAGVIPLVLAMVVIQVLAFGVAWWVGLLSAAICFPLCLVVSRSMGESDIAPEGAVGKVMQLFFALVSGPAAVGMQSSLMGNVMSAGMAAGSASAASDLLTDLKSGHLLGASPRRQFLAQFAGVVFGTLVCVPTWFLLVPDMAALEKFPAPAAQVWVSMARALSGGFSGLAPTVAFAIVIGGLIGLALPVLERALPKAKHLLPSATGIGLGFVIPFSIVLSIALGSVVAAAWRRWARQSEEKYRTTIAAGFIAGDSCIQAFSGMLVSGLGLLS